MKDREKKRHGGIISRLRRWASARPAEEQKIMGFLRTVVRICCIMADEFLLTGISLRAAALTYSIILSMIPMLAMSTAVLKGLGSDNQLRTAAYRLIDELEPEAPARQAVPDTATTTSPAPNPDTGQQPPLSLTGHLRNAVDTIFDYVDRTNFAALGAFGIIGLLIVVILVLSTVESAMNAIWHTDRGRSLFRKVMDYLALLILLPISINVALAGDAILESPKMMGYISTVIPSLWLIRMLLKLIPFLFVVLTLMLMYLFFPAVKVRTSAAFGGAVFAAFTWFVVLKIYVVLQVGVANYNAIYGSFATVPLFLIWLHLGWTFILTGATLAYALQHRNHYHFPGAPASPRRRLQLAFDILLTVYRNFDRRLPTDLEELADALPCEKPGDLEKVTRLLVRGGLLNRIGDNGEEQFLPAAPADRITAAEVIRLVLGRDSVPSTGGHIADMIIRAAEQGVDEKILVTVHPPTQVTDHAS